MALKITNNASSRLDTSIAADQTNIPLRPGDGDLFPSLGPGDWFPVTLVDQAGNREICRCTARSGDMLTVERAKEGTSARAFEANDVVELRLTAEALNNLVEMSGFQTALSAGLAPKANASDVAALAESVSVALESKVPHERTITGEGLVTGGGDLTEDLTLKVEEASEQEAVEGTSGAVAMTPRRTLMALRLFLPVGLVAPFAGTVAPVGWLLCFGQAISRTEYPDLFEALGTTYGDGDGSSTFNVPDLRGCVVAGRDNMGGTAAGRLTNTGTGNPGIDGTVLGAFGGTDRHKLTIAQLAAHTHSFTTGSGSSPGFDNQSGSSPRESSSTGGDEPHPNVQPTTVLNYIIFTGVFPS